MTAEKKSFRRAPNPPHRRVGPSLPDPRRTGRVDPAHYGTTLCARPGCGPIHPTPRSSATPRWSVGPTTTTTTTMLTNPTSIFSFYFRRRGEGTMVRSSSSKDVTVFVLVIILEDRPTTLWSCGPSPSSQSRLIILSSIGIGIDDDDESRSRVDTKTWMTSHKNPAAEEIEAADDHQELAVQEEHHLYRPGSVWSFAFYFSVCCGCTMVRKNPINRYPNNRRRSTAHQQARNNVPWQSPLTTSFPLRKSRST